MLSSIGVRIVSDTLSQNDIANTMALLKRYAKYVRHNVKVGSDDIYTTSLWVGSGWMALTNIHVWRDRISIGKAILYGDSDEVVEYNLEGEMPPCSEVHIENTETSSRAESTLVCIRYAASMRFTFFGVIDVVDGVNDGVANLIVNLANYGTVLIRPM